MLTLLSLMIYPRMCGLIPEPESRPGLSPVYPSSTPGALTSRGRPNKGPAEVYLYPRMCGLIMEPDSRPGLSPVNSSSTPGALTSRGRPNKGPADVYLLPEPQERPHPGSAEGPKQPMLQQRPLPLHEQPNQVGLAEVLPRRVRNLLGPQSSAAFMAASGELQQGPPTL